jgi:hypothetical protein
LRGRAGFAGAPAGVAPKIAYAGQENGSLRFLLHEPTPEEFLSQTDKQAGSKAMARGMRSERPAVGDTASSSEHFSIRHSLFDIPPFH